MNLFGMHKIELNCIEVEMTFAELKNLVDTAFPGVPYEELEIEVQYGEGDPSASPNDPSPFDGITITRKS